MVTTYCLWSNSWNITRVQICVSFIHTCILYIFCFYKSFRFAPYYGDRLGLLSFSVLYYFISIHSKLPIVLNQSLALLQRQFIHRSKARKFSTFTASLTLSCSQYFFLLLMSTLHLKNYVVHTFFYKKGRTKRNCE